MKLCDKITKRKSRWEVFCKKGAFENFVGKHLCWSLFFNKVAGLRPEYIKNMLKKRLQHRCFPLNLVKFLKNSFFKEHLSWLLLCKRFIFVNFFVKKKVFNLFSAHWFN